MRKSYVKRSMCIFNELREKYNGFKEFYDFDKIENIVKEVKEILGLNDKVFPIATSLENTGFSIYIIEMPEKLSGAIACSESLLKKFGSKRLIQINKNESIGHQRFTMAHELAHYIFDYDGAGEYYNEYNLDDLKQDDNSEKRANRFAAALLMPKDMFVDSYDALKIFDVSESEILQSLSDEFRVTKTAAALRIKELKLH